MGMTIVEKIFARASGQARVAAGDLVVVNVDVSVMLDSSFHANHRRRILKVHDPDKVVVVYDHMVPAPDKMNAEGQAHGRTFVKQFGIKLTHDKRAAPAGGRPLDGKTIVVTGTLVNYDRVGIEQTIKKYGGQPSGSVSKKTTGVLAGDNAGSKLAKAESLGIPVLDEAALRELIGERD